MYYGMTNLKIDEKADEGTKKPCPDEFFCTMRDIAKKYGY